MLRLLWLIPAIPFASFIVLALVGSRISKKLAAAIGVAAIAASTVISILITWSFLILFATRRLLHSSAVDVDRRCRLSPADCVLPRCALAGDDAGGHFCQLPDSSLLHRIHGRDEGYSRFFAYMNLFVASMVTLLLADNLLLLYLGGKASGCAATC